MTRFGNQRGKGRGQLPAGCGVFTQRSRSFGPAAGEEEPETAALAVPG